MSVPGTQRPPQSREPRPSRRNETLPPELDPRGRRAAHARIRASEAGPANAGSHVAGQRVAHGALIGTKVLAAALSLAVVLSSYWVWNTWSDFKSSIKVGAPINSVDTRTAGGSAAPKDIDGPDQNILVLGNDSRAGATSAELAALGTGDDGGSANTDTMMILHVPGNGQNASVVSFPRDSYVDIAGHGMAKLNAAYPDGYFPVKNKGGSELAAESAGINLLAHTLQELTGLKLDHYMQVNLLGFYRISNAIGGVPVVLCGAQKEANSGINLPAGRSVIRGKQAMAFVRQRYDVPGSDIGRIARQQYFLQSTFHTMLSAGTLLNPLRVQSLLKAVGSSLVTDPTIDILKLAEIFAQMSEKNLVLKTIPFDGFGDRQVGDQTQSVVLVTPAKVQAFVDALIGKAADPALAGAATVAAGSFTVTVLNASNSDGVAGRNATQLNSLGFKAIVATTTSGTTMSTVIEYANGMQGQAKTVAAQVPGAQLVLTPLAQTLTLRLGTDGLQVKGLTTAPSSKPGSTGTTPAKSATVPVGTGVPNQPNQPGCIA